MGYQPGPLLLQSAGNVGIVTTNYNFAGDVSDQLGDLDTLPGSWEPFLQDAGSLLQESSDPFPDVDIGAAMQTVHAYSDPATLLGIGPMVQALAVADVQLGQAIGFAPAEAWTDSGAPFVAPSPAETVGVPVIPPGSINVTVSGTPLPGPPSTPVAPQITTSTVTLLNTSSYGNPNFRVGDEFQVTALGPINSQVKVHGTLNGSDLGISSIGNIGTDGKLVIPGVMDVNSVGVWHQDWYVNGTVVAAFDFVVVDA